MRPAGEILGTIFFPAGLKKYDNINIQQKRKNDRAEDFYFRLSKKR